MDGAAEVFFRHGFAKGSTREIAALAGVSQGLVAHYFKKSELMGSIARQVSTDFIAALDKALAGDRSPEEQLARVVHSFVESMALNQHTFRVYWKEIESIPSDDAQQARALEKEYVARVAHIVAAAQKQGVLPAEHDALTLTEGILGMLSWTHWWYRPDRHTPQQVSAAYRDLIGLGVVPFGRPPAQSPELSPGNRRLVDSATHVFTHRGFDATTIEEIAAHAGEDAPRAADPLEKERLLGMIAQQVSAEFVHALDQGLGSVREQLTQIIESFLQSMHVNQNTFAVYWREYNSIPAEDAREARARERSFVVRTIGVVAAAQEEGLLPRQHDPLILAEAILGMLSWTHWWYRSHRHDPQEIAAAFSSLIRIDDARNRLGRPILSGSRPETVPSQHAVPPEQQAERTCAQILPAKYDSDALAQAVLSVEYRPSLHTSQQLASAVRDLVDPGSPRNWYPATTTPEWSGKRRSILDSAAIVFFERGYDAGTTKDIAIREGVSQSLVSQYFKKDKMMGAIAQRMSVEFTVALDKSLGSVHQQLAQVIEAFTEVVHAHEKELAVYWAEFLSLPSGSSQLAHARERLFINRASNIVAAAQGQGILPSEHEPGVLTEGILRMAYWLHCVHRACETTPRETAYAICSLIGVKTA
ncbi:TetR family transcriptional regulator [Streptomyces botrytidirepellens]|uniref:TetR family transcriptional regulator n=1 Tax=Streptomyces botrytidirepellens TaxID=2486417 RepID=UPI001612158D|nr:TetR family transcriptional regulator [Streptomyces botrytidirepellens]